MESGTETIRVSEIVRQSIVDGPGLRLTVFTQGCPHACPCCHNPQTHDLAGGYDCTTVQLLQELDRNPLLTGITLTGGEPFCQPGRLLLLARETRRRGKTVWCYSGYTFEELCKMARDDGDVQNLLRELDVLVDGRFLQEQRDLALRFRGSRNQRILNVPRSLDADSAVEAEI